MNFGLENTGRPFTDYNSNGITNNNIKHKNGIKTNNEYRAYLTSNAKYIMHNNVNHSHSLTPFVEKKNEVPKPGTPSPEYDLCASSYSHFTAEKEFRSQWHILLLYIVQMSLRSDYRLSENGQIGNPFV